MLSPVGIGPRFDRCTFRTGKPKPYERLDNPCPADVDAWLWQRKLYPRSFIPLRAAPPQSAYVQREKKKKTTRAVASSRILAFADPSLLSPPTPLNFRLERWYLIYRLYIVSSTTRSNARLRRMERGKWKNLSCEKWIEFFKLLRVCTVESWLK